MNSACQLIRVEEIPLGILFEGYYWYSNQKKPTVIPPDVPIQLSWFTDLPFIVEANFYAKKEQISIHVRSMDGTYHITKIDLSQLDHSLCSKASYVGHDLDGRDFEMIEAWFAQPDEEGLLAGMESLIPAWTAFAGFITKKD